MAHEQVLGVFAKQPAPGQVKTRLANATSPAFATQVAEAFLHDVLSRLSIIQTRRILVFDPPQARDYFASIAWPDWELEPQSEGDLGRRLQTFFATHLEEGSRRVVVLGTDSPTLPPELVTEAFQALERVDVVLGPATDGGYYLLGCSRPAPEIFADIPWGTSQVLKETVARIAETGRRVHLLPPWYDVDTLDDWRMLRGHVAAMKMAGRDPGVAWTERVWM